MSKMSVGLFCQKQEMPLAMINDALQKKESKEAANICGT